MQSAGFTGRQATANAQESIAWGTNIVGGVTPGKESEHLGLPVLPSVRRAMEELRPDATGIYVPASMATPAIEEAIEAEVPLIVAVAEHIPLHDMLRIHSMLKTQSKSRLVGPNSPGIISSAKGERCRIGFQPLPCFSDGCVGIAAKSGTLSYEAVASTTRAGLGQSLCIGVGGDILPGTDLVEALQVLEHDPNTKGIALIGEIGGDGEILAAQWITDYHARTPVAQRKPIVALVAGQLAPLDRVMGHAGAFWSPGEPSPKHKVAALEGAGVTIVNHPAKIGVALRRLMEGEGVQPPAASHQLLKEARLGVDLHFHHQPTRYLGLGIDRATRSQCLMTGIHIYPKSKYQPSRYDKIMLPPSAADVLALDGTELWDEIVATLMAKLKLNEPGQPVSVATRLGNLLRDLARVFRDKEAKRVGLQFGVRNVRGREPKTVFPVYDLRIELDDAAARSAGRLADVHYKYSAKEARDPGAREAEAEGIVYHRLSPGERAHNIGTLVNGAGLAMNTVDALADHGGLAANFLDTGGKATSETVKRSFEIILKDDRVKVVFVNIFGGLTLGDMIARGIVLAYKEVDIRVPVVVRIRGTNEEEGQRIIAESGLPLYAFDDFEEAAEKAVELASGMSAAERRVRRAVKESEKKTAELKKSIQLAAEVMLRERGPDGAEEAAAPADESTDDAPAQSDVAQEHTGRPQDSAKPGVADTVRTPGGDHVA
ncbi:hypothetical protein KVR01_005375 [Diaporthe batatas]|uniref:uncharacterized protein n=1 Tax=Diaporthe batatas TaxID=748121 RepID=UPI001D059313|nr:uncharacterized protein KVR01_005375 [Diaporthe batatas]KAG8165100.1 hypothetical protein KVR01_005375 [Diaporthe batatas]